MKNLRVVIIVAIIAVIAIFIGSAIRSYYLFLKEPVSPVTSALPLNTSVVIRTKSVFRLFESVNNSALVDLFDKTNTGYFQISKCLDTIAVRNNKLYELLKSGESIFALVPGTGNNSSLMIAVSIGKTGLSNLNSRISDLAATQGYQVSNKGNGTFRIWNDKHVVWYYIEKGVFALSADSSLLLNSLNTLSSGKTLASNQLFSKLLSTTGKSVDASILLNNQILAQSVWPSKSSLITEGTPFDGWSSLDLNIKKGEVALGGFTYTQSNHMFKGQEPVDFDQLSDFPPTTAFALSVSLSDQNLYTANFNKKDTLHVQGYDASIKQSTDEIFRPDDHLRSWIGNSVSLIYSGDYFRGSTSEQMILISSKDADSAAWYLKPFIEPFNDSLGKLHYSTLCSDLWGSTFRMQGDLWCIITSNYVAISPGRNILERFANSRGMKDKELQQLKEFAGQSSNVFIYMKPHIIADWFMKKHKGSDKLMISFLGKCKSIGIQYNAGNDLQYTHAWMFLNPKKNIQTAEVKKEVVTTNKLDDHSKDSKENEIVPDTKIAASVETTYHDPEAYAEIKLKSGSYQPQIVSGKNNEKKQIAVLSKKGNVSMYDHTGKQLWSFDSPESLFDRLFEADVNKNGKINYIVVGKKNLYILDQDGKPVKGSPVKLPQTNAGNAALFDYDKKRDYRLLYIGTDKRIYNVTLKGIELPDWQKPKVSGEGDITFSRIAGKDYLIYQYKDQELKFFDRRGKERIKPAGSFKVSANSKVFANETNSKGTFITVTNNGEMVYITNEGNITKSTFGKNGSNSWFTYFDFNADGSKDFIFAHNNRIVAYTKLKKVIVERTLKSGTYGTPFIYSASQKDKWIFARDIETDEVTGFNNYGKTYPYKIVSDSDPIIFNPGGNLKEIIITSKGGRLILKELENL